MISKKYFYLPIVFVLLYLPTLYFLIGWKNGNLIAVLLLVAAFYAHERSRRVVIAFLPWLIYAVIYDAMRALPNYAFNEVDIQAIYELEKSFFGIQTPQGVLNPTEYFTNKTQPVLDFLGGIVYGNWVNVPLILAVYLFIKNKRLMLEFSVAFLLINTLATLTCYIHPAAPPWYVEINGFEFLADTKPNEAGLANFDKMFDIQLFKGMYAMNSQVFAALPSMHSAFPVLVLLYGLKTLRFMNIAFVLHMAGIWFFAVYLRHHYILDILLGVSYVFLIYFLMKFLISKTRLNDFFERYTEIIKPKPA